MVNLIEFSIYRKRIVSGVQPTGSIHLGNYLGAIRNWILLQVVPNCLIWKIDLHIMYLHGNANSQCGFCCCRIHTILSFSLWTSMRYGFPVLLTFFFFHFGCFFMWCQCHRDRLQQNHSLIISFDLLFLTFYVVSLEITRGY